MIALFLTLVINSNDQVTNQIDDITFTSLAECKAYKKSMNYDDNVHLKFTCKKFKKQ